MKITYYFLLYCHYYFIITLFHCFIIIACLKKLDLEFFLFLFYVQNYFLNSFLNDLIFPNLYNIIGLDIILYNFDDLSLMYFVMYTLCLHYEDVRFACNIFHY